MATTSVTMKAEERYLFRTVQDSLGFDPRAAFGIVPNSGFDTVILVSDAYAINEYSNGTLTNRSGSISGSTDPRPFTTSSLADVTYINNRTVCRIPAAQRH